MEARHLQIPYNYMNEYVTVVVALTWHTSIMQFNGICQELFDADEETFLLVRA